MLQTGKNHLKLILVIFIIYTSWCAAAFLFIVLIQGLDITLEQFGTNEQRYIELVHTIVKGTIVFYVLIFHIAIPFARKRNWKKFLLQCLLFFLFLSMYELWFYYTISNPTPEDRVTVSRRTLIWTTIFLDAIILLVSVFIATVIVSNEMRERKEGLEREKLKAELSAIKYQINPHFLFNSLSFIYTKTLTTSPEAAHAVHLLSDIMSYALDDWDELGTVPLELEVDQMKRVIEMNQIRFDNKLKIKYHEYIELKDASIPILTFVTLVENTFKHGVLNDEENPVMIKLEVTKSKVYFMVSNKKKKELIETSHGIGLNNLRQRLQLMFGEKQSFIVKEDENNYLNEITINL